MRHHRGLIFALAAAGAVVGGAGVAQGAERLVLGTYPAATPWVEATSKADKTGSLRELIPADQKIKSWRDILSAQSFAASKDTAPDVFLKGMFSQVGRKCSGARVNGPTPVKAEDGGRVSYGQIYCGRENGEAFGVNMFIKVIQGADALYVVQREFRVPPTANGGMMSFSADQLGALQAMMKAQGEANDYLAEKVFLCADGSPDPRCKAP